MKLTILKLNSNEKGNFIVFLNNEINSATFHKMNFFAESFRVNLQVGEPFGFYFLIEKKSTEQVEKFFKNEKIDYLIIV